MQQPADLDRLKERYRFDEWKDAVGTAGGRAPAIIFAGDELPGWRLVRQTRRQPEGHPTLVRTMWQGDSPDASMGIDLHECASSNEAREYLLLRLGEAEGPALTRSDALDAGEVAFATPGNTMVAFVRGSIVAALHAAGRRVVPLGEAARSLDTLLRAMSEGESR
jgi:hypothetical protein